MQPQELAPPPEPQSQGLTESEIVARRSQGLTNVLPVKTSRTYLQIIGENVFTAINDILFVLGLALVLLGQVSDAVVSVSVVLLNVVVSVIQEVRAKRMLDHIALLNRPTTTVIRDGRQRTIDAQEVVVGDVLQVRPGDQMVVDGPILETERLDVDESLLTGESDLVAKQKGDRLYLGSFCVNGSALYQAEKVGAQSVAYGLAAGARVFRRIYTPLQREINLVIRVMLLFALFFELLLLLGALASQLPTVETIKMAVVIIGLERRSRNGKDEVDRESQGWLAQEKRTCEEKEHATVTLAATSRAFSARRADCEQDSQSQIVCVFASPPAEGGLPSLHSRVEQYASPSPSGDRVTDSKLP